MHTKRLHLSYNEKKKVEEIARYVAKRTNSKISYMYDDQVTISNHEGLEEGCRMETITIITLLYHSLPNYFKLGNVIIDLEDVNSIITLYEKEIERRMANQESAEEIPESNIIEYYEESSV